MEKYFDLHSADLTIKCKMYYGGGARSSFRHVIMFCHGFAGHKDNEAAKKLSARILAVRDDTALVIFNWPAHGDDAHTALSLSDCDAYFSAVLSCIRNELQPQVLDACATSFGGYLLLKYLTDHHADPFRRICLRCPAVVMYDVLAGTILTPRELQILEQGGTVPAGFDRKVILTKAFMHSLRDADLTRRNFSRWADRILIVQGTADEVVPFEAVRSFAAKNGIPFLPVEGADHRFLAPGKMDIVIASFMKHLGL